MTNWVVARKLIQNTVNNLIDSALNVARCRGVVQSTDEARAFVHTGATSITVVDDLLKSLWFPAVDEIGVETVSRGITIGKNEWLLALSWSPTILELGGVPVDLVEHVWDVLPSTWAFAVGGVVHVLLVVLNTLGWVVARRKVDISAKRRSITITVLIWETRA